jgi:hypothetical protein
MRDGALVVRFDTAGHGESLPEVSSPSRTAEETEADRGHPDGAAIGENAQA